MAVNLLALSIKALNITTPYIMTPSMATLSINDNKHNSTHNIIPVSLEHSS